MQTRNLSFLTVGYNPIEFQDFDLQCANNIDEAIQLTQKLEFDVIILSSTSLANYNDDQQLHTFLRKSRQNILLIDNETSTAELIINQNKFKFDKITNITDKNKFDIFILALQEAKNNRQQIELEKMLNERSKKLIQIQKELEHKIEKRSKFLKESRRKLFNTNNRVETYKNILFEIFKLNNIQDIEDSLNKLLCNHLNLTWIKIHLNDKYLNLADELKNELKYNFIQIPITNHDSEVGAIIFMRSHQLSFRRDERDLFNRITEAVSLAVQRIFLFEESEKAHHQWMTTFQSIPAPFVIIDSKYNIIQSNLKPNQKTKCYEVIFNRNAICENCNRGSNFQISDYEIYGQKLKIEAEFENYYIHLYHNIEEKTKYEKRLIETARTTEIGIIGSSIAHELNNPLAGMLSFTQMTLMEIDKQHPLFNDLKQIESAIYKCRDIIQDLLHFSRSTHQDSIELFDFIDCLNLAISYINLLNKNTLVNLTTISMELLSNVKIRGNLNLTAQAVRSVIQYFIDELQFLNNSQNHNSYSIQIKADNTDRNDVTLLIQADCVGLQIPRHHLHLSLTIAGKIFHDQGINLEWKINSDHKLTAIFYFSRPV